MSDEENILTCDLCNTEIKYGFGHCSNCHTNTCASCEYNYYDCHGFHYFAEHNCDNCLPTYGKIINDIYYCPRCAPKESEDEYNFKRDMYVFETKFRNEFRKSENRKVFSMNVITDEELNNPENWKLYKTNPEHFKSLIKERLLKIKIK